MKKKKETKKEGERKGSKRSKKGKTGVGWLIGKYGKGSPLRKVLAATWNKRRKIKTKPKQ